VINTGKYNCPRAFSNLLQEDSLNKPQTFFTSQPIEVEACLISLTLSVPIDRCERSLALGQDNNFPLLAGPLE
jgi:hypothetical protein